MKIIRLTALFATFHLLSACLLLVPKENDCSVAFTYEYRLTEGQLVRLVDLIKSFRFPMSPLLNR